MVRAKFQVVSIEEVIAPEGGKRILMTPVYKDQEGLEGNAVEENQIFGKYTPSGEIKMLIIGEAAALFGVGKFYYADFTEAPE